MTIEPCDHERFVVFGGEFADVETHRQTSTQHLAARIDEERFQFAQGGHRRVAARRELHPPRGPARNRERRRVLGKRPQRRGRPQALAVIGATERLQGMALREHLERRFSRRAPEAQGNRFEQRRHHDGRRTFGIVDRITAGP